MSNHKSTTEKKALVQKHRVHESDTGSTEVQVALLTDRINTLTSHLKGHVKDFHSRRGLLMLVGRRKRLLTYLKNTSAPRYNKIVSDLGLRR